MVDLALLSLFLDACTAVFGGGQASNAAEGYRGTAWRAPDWGPRRACASNLSREELLGSLQVLCASIHSHRKKQNFPTATEAYSVL